MNYDKEKTEKRNTVSPLICIMMFQFEIPIGMVLLKTIELEREGNDVSQ